MNRLNFSLPEFTRIIWVSNKARDLWQPRIDRINAIWPLIERETVVSGLRRGALQSIAPDQLIPFQDWCLKNNQQFVILAQEYASPTYSNASQTYDPKKPWTYRVYVGENPRDFIGVYSSNRAIADYLGYPLCCAEFFQKYWSVEGWRDLTYPMTAFQGGIVYGPPVCNILLKHLGIRAVFHLPCSFQCDETAKLGTKILAFIEALGYTIEADWIYQMLNWPVRWSSLHGVAMITTPVVKIITSSDPLPETVIIDHPGAAYPEEGASGTIFPFESTQAIRIGLKDNWTDNGFVNRDAQRVAHDLILKATEKVLLNPGYALDLGCGNGLLLDKICTKYPFLEPIGVEIDPERAAKARLRFSGGIYQTDIIATNFYLGNYQLILISLNRIKEMHHAAVGLFLAKLREFTRYLFVYSYEPWEEQPILLENFVEAHTEQVGKNEVRILVPKL